MARRALLFDPQHPIDLQSGACCGSLGAAAGVGDGFPAAPRARQPRDPSRSNRTPLDRRRARADGGIEHFAGARDVVTRTSTAFRAT